MHLARYFSDSSLGKHVRSIRNSPREVIYNRQLLVSSALYAMSGLCITWDQGSSSVVPSLPGFSKAFGITSAANPSEVANFISFVYLTAGVGSALSFFINDRIGRLWSLRLYFAIWIIGQLIATFSYGNKGALYTARFVSGLGIGPLTVTGPMSIVEIAPTEIRGLLTVWFSVVMLLSLTIIALRDLPADHPRVAGEIADIEHQIQAEKSRYASGGGLRDILRETFMVPGNLRRVQQSLISYLLAQLSGANSVTSYLVPILSLMGINSAHGNNLFLSSMYSLSKFFYTLIASFFFIDALGRRKSLFIGITIQLISDVYLGAYIKSHQDGSVAPVINQGLLVLPYVFGAELWPNSIRSFGSALSQTFHWLFYFGINRATPSILSSMHNWGAFIFFAGWCLVALIYVFFAVPETAGLPLEHIDALFECPWWQITSKAKTLHVTTISGSVVDEENSPESLDSKYDQIATTSKQTDF
ncbi:related to quinate transport protein [Fusarium fujikuroi]|nr:related to quinate transport protein [Fusarium fujikuroi]SCO20289.1 related to quinate transport protein [Fusarium fujikuroi]